MVPETQGSLLRFQRKNLAVCQARQSTKRSSSANWNTRCLCVLIVWSRWLQRQKYILFTHCSVSILCCVGLSGKSPPQICPLLGWPCVQWSDHLWCNASSGNFANPTRWRRSHVGFLRSCVPSSPIAFDDTSTAIVLDLSCRWNLLRAPKDKFNWPKMGGS